MDGKEKQGKFKLSSPTASPSISEMELNPELLQKSACKILFFFFFPLYSDQEWSCEGFFCSWGNIAISVCSLCDYDKKSSRCADKVTTPVARHQTHEISSSNQMYQVLLLPQRNYCFLKIVVPSLCIKYNRRNSFWRPNKE